MANSVISYDVQKVDYKGYPVFYSRGGMSAELCVAKCLASLNNAESSSWELHGNGPRPTEIHDDFLDHSVNKTVSLYENFASHVKGRVKTVILGPGTMAVPYLAHHLRAIYLPTQFLVSFTKIEDLRKLLAKAVQQNLRSYAVAGYDHSIQKVGVAWLKLLQLPNSYIRLLSDWKIEQVLFVDNNQPNCGENLLKKVLQISPKMSARDKSTSESIIGPHYKEEDVQAQDVFIHYLKQGESQELRTRITDLDKVDLGLYGRGDDWESSMTKQVRRLRSDIPSTFNIRVYLIEAKDSIDLYHMTLHLVFYKFVKKDQISPESIAMNPYFLCNPVYEDFSYKLPFCFWPFNGVEATARNLKDNLESAKQRWGTANQKPIKEVWLKTTSNFGNWDKNVRTEFESQIKNNSDLKLLNLTEMNETEVMNGINNSGWTKWIIDYALKPFEHTGDFKRWQESRKFLEMEDLFSFFGVGSGMTWAGISMKQI